MKTITLYARDIKRNIKYWGISVITKDDQICLKLEFGKLTTKGQIQHEIIGSSLGDNYYPNLDIATKEFTKRVSNKQREGYKSLSELSISNNTENYVHNNIEYSELKKALAVALPMDNLNKEFNLSPMKCYTFKPNKLKYPVYAQPKLNGVRCFGVYQPLAKKSLFEEDIPIKLFSKKGLYYVMPDIQSDLTIISNSSTFRNYIGSYKLFIESIQFDGELYEHGKPLNIIISSIPRTNDKGTISRSKLPNASIKFHIFDIACTLLQKQRFEILEELKHCIFINNLQHVEVVNTITCTDDNHATELRNKFIGEKYEGVILREVDLEYAYSHRTAHMLKYKAWETDEFVILDVIRKDTIEEGDLDTKYSSRDRSYISFKLKNDINDYTFECSVKGSEDLRQAYLNDKNSVIGKFATVKYYERTTDKQLPFHAVVEAVRDYE